MGGRAGIAAHAPTPTTSWRGRKRTRSENPKPSAFITHGTLAQEAGSSPMAIGRKQEAQQSSRIAQPRTVPRLSVFGFRVSGLGTMACKVQSPYRFSLLILHPELAP